MCLVVFAYKTHPQYRLVLAANRDELHQRPSREMGWWPDQPEILAGRDLQAGGTWLAAHRSGRFATVTNYRDHQEAPRRGLRSRGELVSQFVSGRASAMRFNASIDGQQYAGFNLLSADNDGLSYVSNRGDAVTALDCGVYGISNASLDTPWHKLLRTRTALTELIADQKINESELFRIMSDRLPAPVAEIESDHLPFAKARAFTAPFILSGDYGTRCTTILLWDNNGKVTLSEKRFDSAGIASGESRFSFSVD